MIMVFGDVMVDYWYHGVTTTAKEDPRVRVFKMSQRSERRTSGGAAHTARCVEALGHEVSLCGVVGDDFEGDWLSRQFQTPLMIGMLCDRHRVTTTKRRYRTDDEYVVRIDTEVRDELRPDLARLITSMAPHFIRSLATAVVLADYGKGFLTHDVCRALIEAGRAANVPIVVDPWGPDYAKYEGATVICPNRPELADTNKSPGELCVQTGASILAKMDKDGMFLYEDGGDETYVFPAECDSPVDVIGAGDLVVATVAAFLAEGCTLYEATELASLAAGMAVAHPGTCIVNRNEILNGYCSRENVR